MDVFSQVCSSIEVSNIVSLPCMQRLCTAVVQQNECAALSPHNFLMERSASNTGILHANFVHHLLVCMMM